MRKKTVHLSRFAVVALVSVVLGFGILLTGCGSQAPSGQTPSAQPPEEQNTGKVTAKPPAKVTPETKTPAAPAPAAPVPAAPVPAEDPLLAKIMGEKDIFALYSMRQEYEARADRSETVLTAFTKRQNELVAEHKPQTAIDGCLDFVTCSFTNVKDQEHLLCWYFVVTSDITDDWIFNPVLAVDKAHVAALPPEAQQAGCFSKAVFTNASKNPWKKGEHKVLSLTIQLEGVPHDISSRFYRWLPDESRVYTDSIKHGWYAGLKE